VGCQAVLRLPGHRRPRSEEGTQGPGCRDPWDLFAGLQPCYQCGAAATPTGLQEPSAQKGSQQATWASPYHSAVQRKGPPGELGRETGVRCNTRAKMGVYLLGVAEARRREAGIPEEAAKIALM
jgi:hypothetical protein